MPIDLIIMAGGLSTRFGRAKQLEPINDNQDSLIDLSISLAIKNNLENVVIVTHESLIEIFHHRFNVLYNNRINIILVGQSIVDLPKNKFSQSGRQKPWGTAHALWTGLKHVKNDFLLMNADDYYDEHTVENLISALENGPKTEHYMAGYRLSNTIMDNSDNVNRGICKFHDDVIKSIEVIEQISRKDDSFIGKIKNISQKFSGNELTCMNLYGFRKTVISQLENHIIEEVELAESQEISIHEMINKEIRSNNFSLKIIPTFKECYGLTRAEDLTKLIQFIKKENYL